MIHTPTRQAGPAPAATARHAISARARGPRHGFESSWRSAVNGFTLVELLVALLVFAMLSAAGVMLLSGTVSAQGAVTARLDDMAAIERANALLTTDLAQALPRISRTQSGKLAPAFYAEAPIRPDRPALLLVRGGWDDLDGNGDRPTIRKVEYWLVGGRLERRGHPFVDGTAATDATPLVEGITAARLRFRDASGAWRNDWAAVQPDLLPSAVELTIARGGAPLRSLFLVGPGAAPARDDD